MNTVLEWMLGLDQIRLARDAPLLLKWQSAVQPWMVLLFALAAGAAVVFVYRREHSTRGRRLALGVLRGVLLGWVALLLCRPALVLQRNRVERADTVLLLDASGSMGLRETYEDAALAARTLAGAGLGEGESLDGHSRLELARRAILSGDAQPLRELLQRNVLQVLSFSTGTESLATVHDSGQLSAAVQVVTGLEPQGTATDVAGALRSVLENSGGRRLAAVVLVSDGRRTESTGLDDVLERYRGRQIPVYPLRIGSPTPRFDAEIDSVRGESVVYVRDLVSIEGRVAVRGLVHPIDIEVALVDEVTAAILERRRISLTPEASETSVEFLTRPPRAGRHRYRLEIHPPPYDTYAENNAASVEVLARDDRMRVLYVDSYPRFEYRYLKNALQREPSVELSVLLLDADREFVQEGSERIRRFPESPEELHRYGVVLFGDVDPRSGWLNPAQMDMLLDFVGHVGGGFGLIAGERHGPQRFAGTPLERLVPVYIDGRATSGESSKSGFSPSLSPEGRRNGIFRSLTDSAPSAARSTLLDPQLLPPLHWYVRTGGAKPGATALAYHPTQHTMSSAAAGDDRLPMMVVGRYGAGKLFFQATDETWRWRRHSGELLHDGYWVQVLRSLAPREGLGDEGRLVLRTDRRAYAFGAPVRIEGDANGTEGSAALGDSFPVIIRREEGPASAEEPTGESTRDAGMARNGASEEWMIESQPELRRLGPQSNRFEGVFLPRRPGRYVLEPAASVLPRLAPGESARWTFRVDRPERELRQPAADHQVLEEVASRTGGRVLELDEIKGGFASIRDGSVSIPDDVSESLWDSRLALGVFVILAGLEWSLRKWFGLL